MPAAGAGLGVSVTAGVAAGAGADAGAGLDITGALYFVTTLLGCLTVCFTATGGADLAEECDELTIPKLTAKLITTP